VTVHGLCHGHKFMKVGVVICVADFRDLCPLCQLCDKVGIMEFGLHQAF